MQQLQVQINDMDDRSVRRSLDIVMESLTKADKEQAQMLLVPIQKLINRFVNLMTGEKDIDVKQVFESSVTVKNMLTFAEEKGIVIDMSYFNEQST
jgi:hypothetical protein